MSDVNLGAEGTRDERLGRLEAEVHGIREQLLGIREDIRASRQQPKTHVYAVILAIVTAMVTVGTFALAPVTQNVNEVKSRLAEIERHDNDGHPEAVKEKIDAEIRGIYSVLKQMDVVHTRERQDNKENIIRFENRLDEMEKSYAVLDTVADERTKRFKRALDLRDSERETYSASIEQRLRALENGQ